MAEGVRRIGAQRGAVVSTIGPPATIIIAAWLLDERLDGTQIAGVALIMANDDLVGVADESLIFTVGKSFDLN